MKKMSGVILLSLAATACGSQTAIPAQGAAQAGPRTIDAVRVVERPLDVRVSMPLSIARKNIGAITEVHFRIRTAER